MNGKKKIVDTMNNKEIFDNGAICYSYMTATRF